MTKANSGVGRIVLMVAHCAGMVDLVALPVWVGTLVSRYGLDSQQAGGLVTLFLLGAVLSSVFFSSRFDRLPARATASLGFAGATAAFLALAGTTDPLAMAALHFVGGISAGCGLSFTHGTIGRSARPHRLFAVVGFALGVFAIAFMGGAPAAIERFGGSALFYVFGGVMALAALLSGLAFPVNSDTATSAAPVGAGRLGRSVWFAIVGVSLMAVIQAMTFSFVERMGIDRGFGVETVTTVLVCMGIVNLMPAVLAGLLEKRWPAAIVVRFGPVAQASLALLLTCTTGFVPYSVAALTLVGVMIFTHTFAFGLLARMDPSGKAVAATPAMLMIGSAVGPVLGGTLVKFLGYPAIGVVAVIAASAAVICFRKATASAAPPSTEPAADAAMGA
jgi:predicted MFS family arabinose efflux permease